MLLPSLQDSAVVLKKTQAALVRGFTLIEMLVVIGIIVVISGIILTNNARFGGLVQLQNLAYDIALSVRQAQVYGISVQRFSGSTFAAAYGMHFAASSPNTYVLFGDVNAPINGVYDPGGAIPELVQSTTIQSGYGIVNLFVTNSGVESATGTVTSLDVTYRRPDPDACISKNGDIISFNAKGRCIGGINEQARIVVRSPRGDLKSIVISANGQIAVQ